MILTALLRAFPQIFTPQARGLLARTLLLTLLVFAMLGAGLWWGLRALIAWAGWAQGAGLAGAAAAAILGIVALWLLFRVVAMAILGFFSDSIVIAVETRDYPAAAVTARPVSFGGGLRFAFRSVARTVGWNLLFLPLYLLLLVTGIGTAIIFLGLNAYLLGRDLAEMVEPRHPDLPPIAGTRRWLMGLASALLFLLPVVNLLAPIWSAAMAVHMLHGRRRTIP
ncbi:EI24 domain-containing protein [Sphingobium sp. AN641]|uniref:EI24 domain-containing protein n=1 Tax=Sphingobium sp. AN641 TaxID=3133443 RepID=UPI0030C5861F